MRSKRVLLFIMASVSTSLGCDRESSNRLLEITGTMDPFAMTAKSRAAKPTIVIVHGAWADATSFQELIPLLQERHYRVVAVQNPLTSLDADVTTTKRLLDAQNGPVIVVAHSYGGAVASGAAAGNPNVKALVFVSAFAPDANEPVGALIGNYPATPIGTALVPDAAGFVYVDTTKFHDAFAQDLPVRTTRILAATQKPLNGSALTASSPQAAWRTIPSWFMVATDDHVINPDLERFYAKRMNAHTTEVRSSHVIYISHPTDVVRVIEEAATATAIQP